MIQKAARLVHISGGLSQAAQDNARAYERKALFGKIGELIQADQAFSVRFMIRDLTPEEFKSYIEENYPGEPVSLAAQYYFRDYLKIYELTVYTRKDFKPIYDNVPDATQAFKRLPPEPEGL